MSTTMQTPQTQPLPPAAPTPSDAGGEAGRPLPLAHLLGLVVLVVTATTYGLVAQDAYRLVPGLLRATWQAQDIVSLLVLPVLVVSTLRARRGSMKAHVLAVGVLTWLTYVYAHLAIGAAFDAMFLVYVAILGLAGFGMLDGLLRLRPAAVEGWFDELPRRRATWFFVIGGGGIAGLWLAEIVPGLVGDLPPNIHLGQLPNPTWVLDLAWIIPMAGAAAMLLRRRHPVAPVVAGSLLVTLLVLSAAMLMTAPVALAAGLGSDPDVAVQLVAFSVVFTVLGAAEAALLVAGNRRTATTGPTWRARGWWG